MKWNFYDGKLSFHDPDYPFCGNNLSGTIEIDGKKFSSSECTTPVEWSWQICEKDGVLHITAFLENKGDMPVRIDHWNILQSGEDALQFAIPAGDALIFCYFPWNIAVKDFTGTDDNRTDSILLITDKKSRKTLFISFETIDRMYCEQRISRAPGKCTAYAAECFPGCFKLMPGKKVASEKLTIRFADDPHTALEEWADRLYQHYQPDLSEEPETVFHNSWRDLFTLPDRDPTTELPNIIEKVKTHFQHYCKCTFYDAPHYTMKNGLPGNWLTYEDSLTGENFGDFFRRMHEEQGITFKSWFSPFWFFEEATEAFERNKENLQKNPDGTPVKQEYAGGWEFARREYVSKTLTKYFLDGTHPETKKYLKEILSEKRKNGVRSYMLDFLYLLPGAVLYDESMLPVEAARKILQDIREIVGNDTHLQTAVASSPIFIGCVNSARVVRDYCESRPYHPFPNWRNASYCRHDYHFANIHSYLQNAAASYFTNGKIFMNDLNCLKVDEPITTDNARINVTMVGLSGDSPISIAEDLSLISPERLRMLKMCFPRTRGIPRPVDLFTRTAEEGGCRIMVKKITTGYDEYFLAAVFNTMPDAGNMKEDISLALLGCDPEEKYRIYEFWNNEYIGTFRGAFPCALLQDQCKLFRISKAKDHPWLLSTNMHVEQGNCEIKELIWDEEKLTLSGKVCRHAGESGRVIFLMPWNYRVINHDNVNTMKEVIDMQTVVSLAVDFIRDEETFELHFAKDESEYVTRGRWFPYATVSQWLDYVKEHRHEYHPCRVIE